MKVLFILLVLVISSNASAIANAGIFRKGRVFPIIRNRVIINERPATPATPNPPPIITVAPPITQDNVELDKIIARAEKLMEESNKVSVPKPIFPPVSNPMLPIGGAAAGGLAMLLAYLRNAYSFIKG